MDYSEKDIEEYLYEYPGFVLPDVYVMQRQFRTEYGVIDLLGFNPVEKKLVVLELKKGMVDESAVGQIMKYLASVNDAVGNLKEKDDCPEQIKTLEKPYVYGILIGGECTEGVKIITRQFSFLEFCSYAAQLEINLWERSFGRSDVSLNKDINMMRELNENIQSAIDVIKGNDLLESEGEDESKEPETGVL